jgi:hypothetical protein
MIRGDSKNHECLSINLDDKQFEKKERIYMFTNIKIRPFVIFVVLTLLTISFSVAYSHGYRSPLQRHFHFTALMRDPEVSAQLIRYESEYDHSMQAALIIEPFAKKPQHLFFFFHGMDGDSGDGVVVLDLVKKLNAKVISPGGRGPAWLSDAFLADTKQIIAKYSEGFSGYYIIGISMGGTQVLALPGLLPKKICENMLGVIALIPGSDLVAIATKSSNHRVRNYLAASVNRSLTKLEKRSPVRLIEQYKDSLPFVILYDDKDTLLLTGELERFIAILDKKHPVSIFTDKGEHGFNYKYLDYKKVWGELGKDSLIKKPPPLLTGR